MRVNKRKLADILGKSERTLTEWQSAGMPMIVNAGRGSSNEYETADVIAWLVERAAAGSSSESAKDRLSRLQGDLAEIQLAEKAGSLIPAAGIERAWTNMVLAAKSILLTMPERLKMEVDATYGIDVDIDLVTTHVHASLSKLAAHQLPDADECDVVCDGSVHAAAEDVDS